MEAVIVIIFFALLVATYDFIRRANKNILEQKEEIIKGSKSNVGVSL